MRDVILILVIINFVVLLVNTLYCACEYNIFYFPIWRIVWRKAPLNFIGKVIASVLLGIALLPADTCWFVVLMLIRILRHIGYALWWVFAEDRQDVQERWKDFWNNRKDYYCGKLGV